MRNTRWAQESTRVNDARPIADCETAADYVSRDLLTDIMKSEEEHIDWLETQLSLIDRIGIENYCQSQMRKEE